MNSQVSAQSPQVTQQSSNTLLKILALFGVLFLIAASAYAGYWYGNSKRASQGPVAEKTGKNYTYTNIALSFSITYPEAWLDIESPYSDPPDSTGRLPDSKASYVFLAPKLVRQCNVIAPFIPARYLEIRKESGSLDEYRRRMGSKVGGQNYKESSTTLAGANVFVYTHDYDDSCVDGSFQSFGVFLISHADNMFSITTDFYNLKEVKEAVESLQLIQGGSSEEITADWKTFVSKTESFKIRYPGDWIINETGASCGSNCQKRFDIVSPDGIIVRHVVYDGTAGDKYLGGLSRYDSDFVSDLESLEISNFGQVTLVSLDVGKTRSPNTAKSYVLHRPIGAETMPKLGENFHEDFVIQFSLPSAAGGRYGLFVTADDYAKLKHPSPTQAKSIQEGVLVLKSLTYDISDE